MQKQWTIGTTKFHVVMGDEAILESKKDEILNAINIACHEDTEIPDIEGVEFVETYIGDSIVECQADIND